MWRRRWRGGWRRDGDCDPFDSDDDVDGRQAEEDAFLAALFAREEAAFDIPDEVGF